MIITKTIQHPGAEILGFILQSGNLGCTVSLKTSGVYREKHPGPKEKPEVVRAIKM
jgi:hypothetical protein